MLKTVFLYSFFTVTLFCLEQKLYSSPFYNSHFYGYCDLSNNKATPILIETDSHLSENYVLIKFFNALGILEIYSVRYINKKLSFFYNDPHNGKEMVWEVTISDDFQSITGSISEKNLQLCHFVLQKEEMAPAHGNPMYRNK